MLRSLRSEFRDISVSNKEACAETVPDEERSVILRPPRTRLLLIGQVDPTKLQEGTYLSNSMQA